jgi:hypothetical protein
MGRIRKLIKKIKAHGVTQEARAPRTSRTMEVTVTTKNKETGDITKTKSTIMIFDNTYGRTARRDKQLEILEKISKSGFRPKKKLAVKKIKVAEPGKGKRRKK